MASLLFFWAWGGPDASQSRCQQLENLWNCVGEERNFAVNVSQGCPSTRAHRWSIVWLDDLLSPSPASN